MNPQFILCLCISWFKKEKWKKEEIMIFSVDFQSWCHLFKYLQTPQPQSCYGHCSSLLRVSHITPPFKSNIKTMDAQTELTPVVWSQLKLSFLMIPDLTNDNYCSSGFAPLTLKYKTASHHTNTFNVLCLSLTFKNVLKYNMFF